MVDVCNAPRTATNHEHEARQPMTSRNGPHLVRIHTALTREGADLDCEQTGIVSQDDSASNGRSRARWAKFGHVDLDVY